LFYLGSGERGGIEQALHVALLQVCEFDIVLGAARPVAG
jgi:hypothetical protein